MTLACYSGTYLLNAPSEGSEDPRVLLHRIVTGDSTKKYLRAALNLCESALQETQEQHFIGVAGAMLVYLVWLTLDVTAYLMPHYFY